MKPSFGRVVGEMRRLVPAFALALALVCPSASAAPPILEVSGIHPGQHGYGLCDFGNGAGVQEFGVEILGVMRDYAPKQDLILARLTGNNLEKSGVIAGMSGSPVYIDEKLVGAVAYGWPFSEEAIAGITPIASMLDIRHVPATAPVPIGAPSPSGARAQAASLVAAPAGRRVPAPAAPLIAAIRDHDFIGAFRALVARAFPAAEGGSWSPLPTPLSISPLPETDSLFRDVFARAGFVAASSGALRTASSGALRTASSGAFTSSAEAAAGTAATTGIPGAPPPRTAASRADPLRPGSSVATILISGDMTMAATGTVTWVDGGNVLAFGHPFLSMGPVEMPMADSEVIGVLPSMYRSFKFASTGKVLGSISQDRSTGILGSFGSTAAMVPVRVSIVSDNAPAQQYDFQVVQNSMLTPILASMAIDTTLSTLEKSTGERTLVWKSSIATPGRTIHYDSVFSGLNAKDQAVSAMALLTNYLMANEFRDLAIDGIDVAIEHSDDLKSARITEVEPEKDKVRPGETTTVRVGLQDFRGKARHIQLALPIPADTPPGPLTVFVGDGLSATAFDLALFPADPRSLDQVLDFLDRLKPANSVNLLAYRNSAGAVVAGRELSSLPPSVFTMFSGTGSRDGDVNLSHRRVYSASVSQSIPVTGSARLTLDVIPKVD